MDPADGEVPQSTGNAKQRFLTLKRRWGIDDANLDWKKPPEIICVDAMDNRETWKRTALDTQKPDQSVYELIETRKK